MHVQNQNKNTYINVLNVELQVNNRKIRTTSTVLVTFTEEILHEKLNFLGSAAIHVLS